MSKLHRDKHLIPPRRVPHQIKHLRPVSALHERGRRRAVVALVHAVRGRFERREEAGTPAAAAGGLDGGGGVAGEEECGGFVGVGRVGWGRRREGKGEGGEDRGEEHGAGVEERGGVAVRSRGRTGRGVYMMRGLSGDE